MHVAASLMMASVGSIILGSSRFTTRTSPAEYITTPRTSHVLSHGSASFTRPAGTYLVPAHRLTEGHVWPLDTRGAAARRPRVSLRREEGLHRWGFRKARAVHRAARPGSRLR